jgi:hypothetical protein
MVDSTQNPVYQIFTGDHPNLTEQTPGLIPESDPGRAVDTVRPLNWIGV